MQLRSKRRKAPPQLEPAGAKFWREMVEEYGITDTAGIALVTQASECLDRQRAAQAAIAEFGPIVKDRYGAPKLNPACNLEKDARNGMLAALKALNLDLEPLHDGIGRPPGSNAAGHR